MSESKPKKKSGPGNSKLISLHPLGFKEALAALLATKPPQKDNKPKEREKGEKPGQVN